MFLDPIHMTTLTVTTSSLTIRSILKKEKLSGPNFLDWFRQLIIVLKDEKEDYLPTNATKASKDARLKHVNDSTEMACIMLATMTPELQKNFEFHEAFEMIEQLRFMFQF
uniref:Uncharacterized protein n=1 Tax=Lactuca sativa TaxID=4236 RepID=A0A9R1UX51_LACSA|nr:hypothetical protein LSAT_V11C700363990 [Lactuca sativa]